MDSYEATSTAKAVISDEEENETSSGGDGDGSSSSVKWRRGRKYHECTRCRYISERKSNVERHFRRIHCELKRHKTCPCGNGFATKGEYYQHCDKEHPQFRHSWLITTEKYKIGKLKDKVSSKTSGSIKSNHRLIQSDEKNKLRSSPRLASSYKRGVSQDENIIINDIPNCLDAGKQKSEINRTNNVDEVKCFEPLKDQENDTPSMEFSTDRVQMQINSINNISIASSFNQVPEANMTCPFSNLPLKKRFRNLFNKRKGLSDITNFNNDYRSNEQIYIKTFILKDNNNNNKIDEQQRAYISQIDFDELDAIISLAHMKEFNH